MSPPRDHRPFLTKTMSFSLPSAHSSSSGFGYPVSEGARGDMYRVLHPPGSSSSSLASFPSMKSQMGDITVGATGPWGESSFGSGPVSEVYGSSKGSIKIPSNNSSLGSGYATSSVSSSSKGSFSGSDSVVQRATGARVHPDGGPVMASDSASSSKLSSSFKSSIPSSERTGLASSSAPSHTFSSKSSLHGGPEWAHDDPLVRRMAAEHGIVDPLEGLPDIPEAPVFLPPKPSVPAPIAPPAEDIVHVHLEKPGLPSASSVVSHDLEQKASVADPAEPKVPMVRTVKDQALLGSGD